MNAWFQSRCFCATLLDAVMGRSGLGFEHWMELHVFEAFDVAARLHKVFSCVHVIMRFWSLVCPANQPSQAVG
jgi:hypothetical protein